MENDLWIVNVCATGEYPDRLETYLGKPSLDQVYKVVNSYFSFTESEAMAIYKGNVVWHTSGVWVALLQEDYEIGNG